MVLFVLFVSVYYAEPPPVSEQFVKPVSTIFDCSFILWFFPQRSFSAELKQEVHIQGEQFVNNLDNERSDILECHLKVSRISCTNLS